MKAERVVFDIFKHLRDRKNEAKARRNGCIVFCESTPFPQSLKIQTNDTRAFVKDFLTTPRTLPDELEWNDNFIFSSHTLREDFDKVKSFDAAVTAHSNWPFAAGMHQTTCKDPTEDRGVLRLFDVTGKFADERISVNSQRNSQNDESATTDEDEGSTCAASSQSSYSCSSFTPSTSSSEPLNPHHSENNGSSGGEGERDEDGMERPSKWVMASIMDGHSGWQCSEYVSRRLPNAIEKGLAGLGGNLTAENVAAGLTRVFEELDSKWMQILKPVHKLGFEPSAGSTTCCCLISPTKILCANVGDSQAVLARSDNSVFRLSRVQACCNEEEQVKLRSVHPGEDDVCTNRSEIHRKKRAEAKAKADAAKAEAARAEAAQAVAAAESSPAANEVAASSAASSAAASSAAAAAAAAAVAAASEASASGTAPLEPEKKVEVPVLPADKIKWRPWRHANPNPLLRCLSALGVRDFSIPRAEEDGWYVKGVLQPTRSFGDYHLKHPLFCNRWTSQRCRIRAPHSFPYISASPEITIVDRQRNDDFLVVASDGVFDQLTPEECCAVVRRHLRRNRRAVGDCAEAARAVKDEVLKRSAYTASLTVEEMLAVPNPKRRNCYDDITILVLDLQNTEC